MPIPRRISSRAWLALAGAAGLLSAPLPAHAEHYMWVDEKGVAHFTMDPEQVPEAHRESASSELDDARAVWEDWILGDRVSTPAGAGGSEADRLTRIIRGAEQDLRRGETSRAAAALNSVIDVDPSRAEAHWYLALLDRQRGRYDSSESHLRAFLAHAPQRLASQRASAEKRLRALADERRLSDGSRVQGAMKLVARNSRHFRIRVDAELDRTRGDYASTVLRYLEDARKEVSADLGVEPQEPLGVVFYGRARYDHEHAGRFSFATVGFFDGRIHVASPAHPSGELRSLLFHEYTHALYREQTGGDRPYWLNEGLAERIERRSRRAPASTRGERASLRARIDAGSWIPLRSIARSFSGLSDEDARIAYLESVVVAEWLEGKTTREERAQLLARIGRGFSVDQALYQVLGLDTDGVDAAVRAEIRSEFPDAAEARAEAEEVAADGFSRPGTLRPGAGSLRGAAPSPKP